MKPAQEPPSDVPAARPELPTDVVARIRRERQAPRLWHWDAPHLEALRRGIVEALTRLPVRRGPALDVWCGTKPYDVLLGGTVIGLDIDRHFGAADVLGRTPFPLRDGAVDMVLCSQALHILPDPAATVSEMHRVLAPGGHALVTVPGLMLRLGPSAFEGRHTRASFAARFAGWESVDVQGSGGPGAAAAHAVNLLLDAARRRAGLPAAAAAPLHAAVNLLGMAVEALARPWRARYPHVLVLTARRPAPAAGADVPDDGA